MLAGWIMNSAMKNNTICAHENDTLLSLYVHPPKTYFLCLLIMTMPLSNLFALCLPCIHICTSITIPWFSFQKHIIICFPVMRKNVQQRRRQKHTIFHRFTFAAKERFCKTSMNCKCDPQVNLFLKLYF